VDQLDAALPVVIVLLGKETLYPGPQFSLSVALAG